MPQQFEQPQAQQAATQEDDALATTQAAAQTESTDQADVLDDILDDIESALETNAEEYVNSFVQKGGEGCRSCETAAIILRHRLMRERCVRFILSLVFSALKRNTASV